MSDSLDLSMEGVERRSLSSFTEEAYLNYSMYVIMDRALPHTTVPCPSSVSSTSL